MNAYFYGSDYMSNSIKFNNIEITAPKVFKPSFKDLDSDKSTRNANGVLNRDRIRAAMRTLHFEWGPLTLPEISTILQAINPAGISVYYPDPMDGVWETRTVYAGDRSTDALYDFDSSLWNGLSFDLVEY